MELHSDFLEVRSLKLPLFLGYAIKCAINGDPLAVECVRQLSYAFYKLEVGYDEKVVKEFLDQFRNTDSNLPFVSTSQDLYVLDLVDNMRALISRVLCNADPLDIVPSHGSGATACRTPNWDKYHKLRYYPKLDNLFSYSDYFFFSLTHLADEYEKLENSEVSIPRARVCLVPKDSRGPRIISCEPAELMYIQQGLMRKLYATIENHPMTIGHVNFSDQVTNRELARTGSIDNSLATLDLSEASDRVSLDLVRQVFPANWVEALEACRSEETLLPDGSIVKLNKFAPMGSSCCFPVEALVFWACAQASLQILHKASKYRLYEIFVYGDDIITPQLFAEDVIHGLESIGLLVNRDKCYVNGPFRESCGGDFYLGVDVTPIRVRKPLGTSRTTLSTASDFCNLLLQKFGPTDSYNLIHLEEEEIGYVFPRSELMLPGTIRSTPSSSNDVFFRRRFNRHLQRFEHRVLQPASKSKLRRRPDWAELLRKQCQKNVLSYTDPYKNPLAIEDSFMEPGEYTEPHSVVTKWEWTWLG
jgi:hypothetical protein